MSSAPKPRPKYYDLSLLHLPPPGLVSILHRISGLLLFFPLIPIVLYMLDSALASDRGYDAWRDFFARTPVKVVMLGVIWTYAHHFWAGIRFLLLDLHWQITKEPAQKAAIVVLALGVITTAVIGWRLW